MVSVGFVMDLNHSFSSSAYDPSSVKHHARDSVIVCECIVNRSST
jgi:hypothetical protein